MAEVWTPPAFDDITTSELVTAAYLNGLGNSLRFLKEVAYVEFTSNVSITTTADIQIVSAGAITYEAVPHLIEFFTPNVNVAASGSMDIMLRDSTTDQGLFTVVPVSSANISMGVLGWRLTPTAASHTYNVAARNNVSQTSTVLAGAGGADARKPGYIRITRIPT